VTKQRHHPHTPPPSRLVQHRRTCSGMPLTKKSSAITNRGLATDANWAPLRPDVHVMKTPHQRVISPK